MYANSGSGALVFSVCAKVSDKRVYQNSTGLWNEFSSTVSWPTAGRSELAIVSGVGPAIGALPM